MVVRLTGVSLRKIKRVTAVEGFYLIKVRVLCLCRCGNDFLFFKGNLQNEKINRN